MAERARLEQQAERKRNQDENVISAGLVVTNNLSAETNKEKSDFKSQEDVINKSILPDFTFKSQNKSDFDLYDHDYEVMKPLISQRPKTPMDPLIKLSNRINRQRNFEKRRQEHEDRVARNLIIAEKQRDI